ncbi:MAG: hypothetical protein ACRDO1_14600 [Nocardioidaceae bacterium]
MTSTQSGAERVAADLHQQTAHIAKALASVAQASQQADRASQQAAGVGYRQVAEGLHSIRGQIDALHQPFAQVTKHAQAARAEATKVTVETTPEDAAKLLTAASNAIESGQAALMEVHAQVPKIEADVAMTLRGAKPGSLLAILGGVRAATVDALTIGKAAGERCAQTIARGSDISGDSGN